MIYLQKDAEIWIESEIEKHFTSNILMRISSSIIEH